MAASTQKQFDKELKKELGESTSTIVHHFVNKRSREALAKKLDRCAAVLDKTGWRRDEEGKKGEPHCVLGTFKEYPWNEYWHVRSALINVLNSEVNEEVTNWNDSKAKSKEQVSGSVHDASSR